MGSRDLWGLSIRFIVLIITPLAGGIIGIVVALDNPETEWQGVLIAGIFFIIFIIQWILFIRAGSEVPNWTGFLLIGVVIFAVVDNVYKIEEVSGPVFISIMMVWMYGIVGLLGVVQWIRMGIKSLENRYGKQK